MKLLPDSQNSRINLYAQNSAEVLPERGHNIISGAGSHNQGSVLSLCNLEGQFVDLLASTPRGDFRLRINSLRREIMHVLMEITVYAEIPLLTGLIPLNSGFQVLHWSEVDAVVG